MTTNEIKQNNEQQQKKKSNLWPILLGTMGFMLMYVGVNTDDDRMALPAAQAKEMASEKTTTAMEFAGAAAMLTAVLWGTKRKEGR